MLTRIADGRTDLVFAWCAAGHSPRACDAGGVSLVQWCAYYGDVSAIRFLTERGVALTELGMNFNLNGAAFHSHWQLCQFLLDHGADANSALPDTGETPLHAAVCHNSHANELVVQVLLDHQARVQVQTIPGLATGSFMRDCRTTGETPLHRAAAFASEGSINLLIDAGADRTARDTHGDSPLSWASRHQRPLAIIRLLCFEDFRIHPQARTMGDNLLGVPHAQRL